MYRNVLKCVGSIGYNKGIRDLDEKNLTGFSIFVLFSCSFLLFYIIFHLDRLPTGLSGRVEKWYLARFIPLRSQVRLLPLQPLVQLTARLTNKMLEYLSEKPFAVAPKGFSANERCLRKIKSGI